jgi:hypothetical protein
MHEFAVTSALSISFQRYPYPSAGYVSALPNSYGALPFVATGPRQLIMPSPADEAFWIGLIATPHTRSSVVQVVASLQSGQRLDVLTGSPLDESSPSRTATIVVPPQFAIIGIVRDDGTWWPFTRTAPNADAPACSGIDLFAWVGSHVTMTGETGDPQRLHDAAGRFEPSPPESAPPQSQEPDNSRSVHIDLTDIDAFEAMSTKRIPPLDSGATYGGWRLP